MRWIPDRFWWAQRYGGAVMAAGCLFLAVFQFIDAYESYQLAQVPVSDPNLQKLLSDDATISLLQGGQLVLLVALGVFYVWASFRARERFRRRLRAIEGEQGAMRRAAVPIQPNHAPDLSSEPLELLWRATPLNSRIMTTLLAIMLVIFAPIDGLFWYLGYCLATNTPPIGSTGLEPLSPLERVGAVGVLVLVAVLLLVVVVFLINWFPVERGRPYGVTASDEGLWYYPRGWKRRFLRWDEVRLLEVRLSKNGRYREYKLYGCESIARWVALPPSSLVTLDLTKQEFEQQHQALLDLIVARTHLLPRTLDTKLAEASGV